MSLMKSSGELTVVASTLKPQQANAQRTLEKGHSKKICVLVSSAALHKVHVGSILGSLTRKLALVGIALAPILQTNPAS